MKKQTVKKSEAKPLNVYRDHVAGVQYSDYQLVNFQAGDEIELRREPKNPADTNDIAVYVKNTRIGYIPRMHCPRLIGLKRDGSKFSGRIVSYNKNNPSWQAIVICVHVTMPTVDDIKDGEVL